MTAALEELLALAAADPGGWHEDAERSGRPMPVELGEEALAASAEAREARDLDRAQLAAMVASELLLAHGMWTRSLGAQIEVVRLSLLDAPTGEACARVRFEAGKCATMATTLGDEGLAFAAAVVVGEASHGAWLAVARAQGTGAADAAWLGRALDDTVEAAGRCGVDAPPDALDSLAALAYLVVDKALRPGAEVPGLAGERLGALGQELVRIKEGAAAARTAGGLMEHVVEAIQAGAL